MKSRRRVAVEGGRNDSCRHVFLCREHSCRPRRWFQGLWMGYFGFRSAPLGVVQPAVVEALFNNFSADRVNRALPDAWSFATPRSAACSQPQR